MNITFIHRELIRGYNYPSQRTDREYYILVCLYQENTYSKCTSQFTTLFVFKIILSTIVVKFKWFLRGVFTLHQSLNNENCNKRKIYGLLICKRYLLTRIYELASTNRITKTEKFVLKSAKSVRMKISIRSLALTQFGAEKIAFLPKPERRTDGWKYVHTDGH